MSQPDCVEFTTIDGNSKRILVGGFADACRHRELAPAERWDDLPPEVQCKECGRRFGLEVARIMMESPSL